MKFPSLKIYNLVSSPKVPTDVLWDLSILFSILAVIYFGAIFFFRNKFKKDASDTASRKKILAPMVSEFLFYEENIGTKEEKNSYINRKIEIRELIKDKKNEAVLSEILLDLKTDVSGQTRKLLFKLYKDLNLQEQAFEKLKSFRWQKISQGMFELTQMQVVESYSFIRRFINDKRSVVRKQAEISTVTLMHEGISYFLDTTKYSISEWQQLKILEVLSNAEYFEPPRFYKWLTSKNKHVVLFALRLIKHYDQNDAEESIISLVRHKNTNIKHEAISCIKKFNFQSSTRTLKAVFWKNNAHIKLAILDTLASFERKEDIPFLELVDKKESNFTVKSKALSAINTIWPEYVMPTDGLDSSILEEHQDESFEEIVHKVDVSNDAPDDPEFEKPDSEEAIEIAVDSEPIETNQPEVQLETPSELLPEYERVAHFLDSIFVNKNNEDKVEAAEQESVVAKDPISSKSEINTPEPVFEVLLNEDDAVSLTTTNSDEIKVDNSILEQSETIIEDNYQSIFEPLFNRADDECKMLLLDEILEIGNNKDIPFLTSLQNHHNTLIRTKAVVVKAKLLDKFTPIKESETLPLEVLNLQTTIKVEEELVKQRVEINQTISALPIEDQPYLIEKKPKDLMPLEFCFLLEEFDLEPAKPLDLFEVEFAPEFSKDLKNSEHSSSSEPIGLTAEEHTYFQQLLEFPLTKRKKFNG
ncbi:hypothetical protein SAMN05660703_2499 [Cellulophaga tyrosinoxydans]|uniref:HEAT repeat-containing protein n=1 Tax=Cellulophaga tyrosinoxydans TaxID=504486 RepID=A0A1W2BL89_9FLAO|nr:hypothetical protein SAMN05660703_2499 [Cellulophaga tyrosinoxydans]